MLWLPVSIRLTTCGCTKSMPYGISSILPAPLMKSSDLRRWLSKTRKISKSSNMTTWEKMPKVWGFRSNSLIKHEAKLSRHSYPSQRRRSNTCRSESWRRRRFIKISTNGACIAMSLPWLYKFVCLKIWSTVLRKINSDLTNLLKESSISCLDYRNRQKQILHIGCHFGTRKNGVCGTTQDCLATRNQYSKAQSLSQP